MHLPRAWSVPWLSTVHCWALVPLQVNISTGVKSAVPAPRTSTHSPSTPVIASVLLEAEPLLVPGVGEAEAEPLPLGAGAAEGLPLLLGAGEAEVPLLLVLAAGPAELPPPVIALKIL